MMMAKGLFHKLSEWINGDALEHDEYLEDEQGYAMATAPDAHHVTHAHGTHGLVRHADMMPTSSVQEQQALLHEQALLQEHKNKRAALRVVPGAKHFTSQIVIVEPENFQEVLYLIEPLRNSRTIILNLGLLDTSQSQRAVDFMAGATHAISGHQQQIADKVFIFTPSNVELSTTHKDTQVEPVVESGMAHLAAMDGFLNLNQAQPALMTGTR
ncbi:MAG: cell division protein SepF [Vampirovibrionales bacterium]